MCFWVTGVLQLPCRRSIGNLGAALQGLAVVPLFVGFDLDAAPGTTPGRIFSYDVTGGKTQERGVSARRCGLAVARKPVQKIRVARGGRAVAHTGPGDAAYDPPHGPPASRP